VFSFPDLDPHSFQHIHRWFCRQVGLGD
jgi:hypothetical protein